MFLSLPKSFCSDFKDTFRLKIRTYIHGKNQANCTYLAAALLQIYLHTHHWCRFCSRFIADFSVDFKCEHTLRLGSHGCLNFGGISTQISALKICSAWKNSTETASNSALKTTVWTQPEGILHLSGLSTKSAMVADPADFRQDQLTGLYECGCADCLPTSKDRACWISVHSFVLEGEVSGSGLFPSSNWGHTQPN